MAQGIIPESSMRDFSGVSLLDQPGDKTFPIVLFSYIYVRQDIRYIGASGELACPVPTSPCRRHRPKADMPPCMCAVVFTYLLQWPITP